MPPNRVEGEVTGRRSLGAIEELVFRSGPLALTVHAHSSRGVVLPTPGERVTLLLHPQDIVPLEPESAWGEYGAEESEPGTAADDTDS